MYKRVEKDDRTPQRTDKVMDIDEVKKYLDNELDEEERRSLEARLRSDPAFSEEFKVNKAVLMGLEDHFDRQLKEKLQARDRLQAKKKNLRHLWLAAASIALILTVGIIAYQRIIGHDNDQIFLTYYRPYYNIVDESVRGDVEGQTEAFRLYDQRDYMKAALAFEEELLRDPGNKAFAFYCGLSYLEAALPTRAIVKLESVAKVGGAFREPAQWYAGLAYLKLNQQNKATKAFKNLAENEGSYQEKAKAILKALE